MRPLLYLALAMALAVAACDADSNDAPAPANRATPVTVTAVERADVDVHEDYAGRVHGARTVEVRARVQGILEARHYREGQIVANDAPLFRIDPQPFEVALRAASAEFDHARAELRQAERNWQRVSRLFERDTISERERDNALAAREIAQARVAMSEARVAQARLELGYTEVRAPLAGVTSLEAVPEGSLLERGALLTTIVQHDPVHVHFALPEEDAALHRAARPARPETRASDSPFAATIVLPGGSEYALAGEVDFTASTINPRTGSVSARAVFDNPDNVLVPGQFVRVRVLLRTLADVVLLPEEAVGQDRDGPRVFVVDDDNTARARKVALGPTVNGRQAVLAGIENGERVVVNGQVGLRDGMPVAPRNASGDRS